jgi:hypothetical protein
MRSDTATSQRSRRRTCSSGVAVDTRLGALVDDLEDAA